MDAQGHCCETLERSGHALLVFAMAVRRWFDDCERFGWTPGVPSAMRSVVRPGSIVLCSTKGHLATYSYDHGADACVILTRTDGGATAPSIAGI